LLGDLDQTIADARVDADAAGAMLSVRDRAPAAELGPEPSPRTAASTERGARTGATEAEREVAHAESSEAVLLATQLAVIGTDREQIATALRADFPNVDAESLLDEILS
jgi:hypothetical protein